MRTWLQSVPRGSGWVRSPKPIDNRLHTHPLPRGGTDCSQVLLKISNSNNASIKLRQTETTEDFVVTRSSFPKKIDCDLLAQLQ